MSKKNDVVKAEVVEAVEVSAFNDELSAEDVALIVENERLSTFNMVMTLDDKERLTLVKDVIIELSGKDKLALFNWLKGRGGNGKTAAVKNVGVGDFVREKIFEGLSNNEIVEECKSKYGNEQTGYNCVVWYRNKMKKEGLV